MNSKQWQELYELVKKATIEYCQKPVNCIIAEYDGQVIHHEGFDKRNIFISLRTKYKEEYAKFKPLTEYDLSDSFEKMLKEGIIFRIYREERDKKYPLYGRCEYALNRKYAVQMNRGIALTSHKAYAKSLHANFQAEWSVKELAKLSTEDKLKHKILFDALPTVIISELLDNNIYTYYDLVILRPLVVYCGFYNLKRVGQLQKHLQMLGLDFYMYEWNGKIKTEQNQELNNFMTILSKIYNYGSIYENDHVFRYFKDNKFIFEENSMNYVRGMHNSLRALNLEKYFTFGVYQNNLGTSKMNQGIYTIEVNKGVDLENINTILKMKMGY